MQQSGPADIPTNLTHTVSFAVDKPSPPLLTSTMTETLAPTMVQQRQPIAIAISTTIEIVARPRWNSSSLAFSLAVSP